MKKHWPGERSILALCILLGATQAWVSRYAMNSDGVSYLDIGDAYLRGDWSAALNSYWSPMYSWWLGLALYVLKPSIWWEYLTVHAVNLVIYVVALFCFRFFIQTVLRTLREESAAGSSEFVPLPDSALLVLGYGLFLWCSLVLIDLGLVTPDLLVAAILFLIGGLLVDLRARRSYWKFAAFGALNGLAYLSKGVMFPLGFGFLAILLFSGKVSKARIFGVLLSAAVFVLVSSPFIFVLSKAKGRLTFGDTGALAYAALVTPGIPQIHWQGLPAGSGIPRHATRRLQDHPGVFEFGVPIKGTYPPWDDPTYWEEGAQWHFRLRSQLRTVVESAFVYEKLFLGESALIAGALIFLFIGGKPTLRGVAANWPLLCAAFLSLAIYALVLVITRYVGGFLVLLWMAIVAGVHMRNDEGLKRVANYVAGAVAITLLLSVAGYMVNTTYTNLTVGENPTPRNEVEAAAGLREMGLREGEKVAVVGHGILNHWARLGRFKIVSEITPADRGNYEFWASPTQRKESAYECLERTGARAVIAWDPPENYMDQGWKQVSNTRYYVRFLSR